MAKSGRQPGGLDAISGALAAFADENNLTAIARLGNQLKGLSSAMNLPIPQLINQLERLGRITREQANALREVERIKWAENVRAQFRSVGAHLGGGDLFGAIYRLGPALRSLGGPMGNIAGISTQAGFALLNMGKQMESMIAKANPAAAFQFNRALDDLVATLGQILMPIFEGLTSIIRAFADVLQALKPIFEIVTETIGAALKFIGKAVTALAELIGGKKDSSVGAAVRPAAYGSIEEIGKRTTLNVLNQGPKKDPGQETFDMHQTIKQAIKDFNVNKGQADKIGKVAFPNLDAAHREVLNRFIERQIESHKHEPK